MPWYAAGTINVAASGTTATGSGTAFLGNVRVGDGIAIQGSSSLHEVTGVTSDTQLTFAPPYAGTAGGGKFYRVAPVLGYDKDLSDAFNALRLQFGDQLSSLAPWATASTGGEAMDELGFGATGKSVAEATTPAEARSAIGVQDWAAADNADAALDELGFSQLGKDLASVNDEESARDLLELGDAAVADVVGTMVGGAIIESDSNSNGSYIKWADGTMMSAGDIISGGTITAGATANHGVKTFAAEFYGAPQISFQVSSTYPFNIVTGCESGVTGTSFQSSSKNWGSPGTDATGVYLSYTAFGRWKA